MVDDLAGCLNFLDQNRCLSLVSDQAFARAVTALLDQSLPTLLSVCATISNGTLRDRSITLGFSSAGAKAPQDAMEYIEGVPDHLKASIYASFSKAWVGVSGPDAVKAILNYKGASRPLVESAVLALAAVNFSSAAKTIISDAPASMHDMLLMSIFDQTRLSLGEKWKAIALLPNGSLRDYLAPEFAAKMIAEAPADSATILASLGSQALASRAVEIASRQISTVQNPAETARFIEALPSTYLRTRTAKTAAGTMARSSLPEAMEWSGKLTDPVARTAAMRTATEYWLVVSPATAFEYAARQMEKAPASEFANLAPAWFGQILNEPRVGPTNSDRVDLTALRTLSPTSKELLAKGLAGRLSPETWQKFQGYIASKN
jgi:hypothetical protein